MKIRLLYDFEIKDVPGVDCLLSGQIIESGEVEAEMLIAAGLAEQVPEHFETTEKKQAKETTELPRANRG